MTQLSKPVTVSLLWLWAGAAIMFGALTAPTLFNPNVLDNRELSGAIAGAILKRFYTVSNYVFGACLLVSLLGWLADMKTRRKLEMLFFVCVLLLGVNIFQDQVIRTKMVRIKLELKNAANDGQRNALRTQFDDWHKTSVSLFGGSVVLVLISAGWTTLAGARQPGKSGRK